MIDEVKKKSKAKVELSLFEIPDAIIPLDKRLFYPTWENKPPYKETVIKSQGKRVLTNGNILSIISKAGTGKSSICESIIASWLNPKCDALGMEVNLPKNRDKILYVDTERTLQDTWNSWERINYRAKIKSPTVDKRLVFVNFKAVASVDRKRYVEEVLNKNPDIGLVIFDGASDFIRDTNSIFEAQDFIDWINAFNSNISIVVTLHTNPNDTKPRGHIGSELWRKSESVLLARKLENGVRELTTDFDNGKVRNDDDKITSYYQFSETENMFISCPEYSPSPKNNREEEKKAEYIVILNEIFNGITYISATKLITLLSQKIGKSEQAAKAILYRKPMIELLVKDENGFKLA